MIATERTTPQPAPARLHTRPVAAPQRTARIAGLLYLVLAVCGGFAEFFVRQGLIVRGDAEATVANILASPSLFRFGIFAELVGQVAFVLLVIALYRVLKPVGRDLANAMAALVLVAVTITSLNMLNQVAPLVLLSGAPYLGVFEPSQLHALALGFLDLHEAGYMIAQVFFGLWLLPLGILIVRSGFLPKVIGAFLMLACAGYVVDVATYLLAPGFGITFSEFTFVGELMLMLWLVIFGVNVRRWEARGLHTA